MNEAAWKRLLNQIRDGVVIPVVGPQLLVGADGRDSLQGRLADRLLRDHDCEPGPQPLPPFRELHEAVSRLKSLTPEINLQDLYYEIYEAINAVTEASDFAVPPAIRQLAEIADFRLFVTLTPDDLLARSLRKRCAVNEIIHSPALPTSEGRDLPGDWRTRSPEVYVLYLFGKLSSTPVFAIHDEDVLEYAHNMIARGSHVPAAFLGELQQRNLLLIGCNFPDWLSRFFLRVTNKCRLSESQRKREWLIEQMQPVEGLTGFLRSYSANTEILSQVPPVEFVAELYQRWTAGRAAAPQELAPAGTESVSPGAVFFVSYSRSTDLPRAEALVQALLKLGLAEREVWFDRQAIEPGQDFRNRILEGIRSCRYFLPLLSEASNRREEAFVFREWREANDRRQGMNREFVYPVIVDADYEPERYTVDPVRGWAGLDFGHAPEGTPDRRTLAKLTKLLRGARIEAPRGAA
jgi:hypothetical protein